MLQEEDQNLREHHSHTTLEAILKGSLAASTGQNLRLQHQILRVQILGDLFRFLGGSGHTEPVTGNVEVSSSR